MLPPIQEKEIKHYGNPYSYSKVIQLLAYETT
jgi:hypothetical protein